MAPDRTRVSLQTSYLARYKREPTRSIEAVGVVFTENAPPVLIICFIHQSTNALDIVLVVFSLFLRWTGNNTHLSSPHTSTRVSCVKFNLVVKHDRAATRPHPPTKVSGAVEIATRDEYLSGWSGNFAISPASPQLLLLEAFWQVARLFIISVAEVVAAVAIELI